MAELNQIQVKAEAASLFASFPPLEAPKSIRLLDIFAAPGPEDDGQRIRCSLRVVDLDADKPHFTAISYVWGTKADGTALITCMDTALQVTTNCHAALHHLRKKFGQFTIWIDAICINQKDEKEKMRQIPLMGDIFSLADKVFAWLGEGDDASYRAMAWLQTAGFPDLFPVEGEERLKPNRWVGFWAALTCKLNPRKHLFPSIKKSERSIRLECF
jgi:Heterokaryon incompatibility protein (HET)